MGSKNRVIKDKREGAARDDLWVLQHEGRRLVKIPQEEKRGKRNRILDKFSADMLSLWNSWTSKWS